MTEEQKDILIGKLVDNPLSLSADETDAVMNDRELLELYETLVMVQSAYKQPDPYDMDKEWSAFRQRAKRPRNPLKWMLRIAAIIAICILAYPVINKINPTKSEGVVGNEVASEEQQEISENNNITLLATAEQVEVPPVSTNKQIKHKQKRRRIEPTGILASTPSESVEVDVDEYLRIQQARIENELAMQNAQLFEENYSSIQPLLELLGVDNTLLNNTLKKVTMQ